jgi:aconitate hydratase
MDMAYSTKIKKYRFDNKIYKARVYNGVNKSDLSTNLVYGPNIADWPKMEELKDNLLLKVVSVLNDPVTTTDELIPSGETSSYRSNPLKLSEFALSRRVPEYVSRSKAIQQADRDRRNGIVADEIKNALAQVGNADELVKDTSYGSCVFATKPGDGSAREQAASCQRVLGGVANIAIEYATKRYRSNLINWGMIPFLAKENDFSVGEYVYVENVKELLLSGKTEFKAKVLGDNARTITLKIDPLTDNEKQIIVKGCLINYYKG